MHYDIEIEGVGHGLVMNNPIAMSGQSTRVPKPEQEAEQKCYRLPPTKEFKKGELYAPSEWLMATLLSVTQPFKLKLRGKTVSSKKWLAGGSEILPDKIGLGTEAYEVYITSAVIQKSRVLRARARVKDWSLAFRLEFSDADPLYGDIALALQPVIKDMWTMAGVMSGIGDNRPNSPRKPGRHGKFRLVRCELNEG